MSNSISNGGLHYPPDSQVSMNSESASPPTEALPASKNRASQPSTASGLLAALGASHTPALDTLNNNNAVAIEHAVHEFLNDPTLFFQSLSAAIGDL